ncbi:MAG: lasso peptide biosynthesis PqqD family chaperone [Saccharothrix sp.]|nr:lasso peptide biosynthesis PqqD family chaperone [Saccharothrix sp.]
MAAVALSPFVVVTETEDGMVFLNKRTRRYWQLNGTGSEILRLLLNGETEESAANKIHEKYANGVDHVLSDVHDLVRHLRTAELIVR